MNDPHSKLFAVLEAIINASIIAPDENVATLDPKNLSGISDLELDQILKKIVGKGFIQFEGILIKSLPGVRMKKKWVHDIEIRILDKKGLREYKNTVAFDLEAPIIQEDLCRFHFDPQSGVLHRDGVDKALIFKKGDLQYSIIEAAFQKEFGTKIGLEDVDCLRGNSLCGAAYKINTKILETFKIDDFFTIYNSEEVVSRSRK